MENEKAWGRAIWSIRLKVLWFQVRPVLIELWDVFTAIFAVISAVVIACVFWGLVLAQIAKAFGLLE